MSRPLHNQSAISRVQLQAFFSFPCMSALTSQVIRLLELLVAGGTHGPLLLPAFTQSLARILRPVLPTDCKG